jgi:hypothetical protein
MKKQITEIEREITEKSNRPISATMCITSTSSSLSETTTSITQTASSISQSTFKLGSVVPTVNLSSQNNSTCGNPIIIESGENDIDLELLDPLGEPIVLSFGGIPHHDVAFLHTVGMLILFQLLLWIDARRRLLLQPRLPIEKAVHSKSN